MPFPPHRPFLAAPVSTEGPGWRFMLLAGLVGTIGLGSVWGCRPGAPRRPLQDRDPVFVIPAIKQVAKEQDWQDVPRLIELLTSEDSAVRLYAIQALQRMAGENFGYVFWREPAGQTEAILRWQRWAANRGLIPAEDLPPIPTTTTVPSTPV